MDWLYAVWDFFLAPAPTWFVLLAALIAGSGGLTDSERGQLNQIASDVDELRFRAGR